jgi:hypothetical protein
MIEFGPVTFNVLATPCEFVINTGTASSLMQNWQIEWGQNPLRVSIANVIAQYSIDPACSYTFAFEVLYDSTMPNPLQPAIEVLLDDSNSGSEQITLDKCWQGGFTNGQEDQECPDSNPNAFPQDL